MHQTAITIVDNHPILREGLAACLSNEPDFEIVATASSADEVSAIIAKHRPDVLVIDEKFGNATCIKLMSDVPVMHPRPAVVILTSREDAESTMEAIRLGASACVLKVASVRDLVTAVRCVARGEMWISPPLLPGLLGELQAPVNASRFDDRLGSLTEREVEVLDLMVEGLGHQKIAEHLHVAITTVRTHTRNIQMKLQVHSNLAAVAMALRAGIRPNEREVPPYGLRVSNGFEV